MRRQIFVYLIASLTLTACTIVATNDDADELDTNKEVVMAAAELVNARDYDRLSEIFTADYKRVSQATPDVIVEKREDFQAFLEADALSFPDGQMAWTKLIAEGDHVAFWGTYSGTQTGQMGPFPPTGKRMTVDFAGYHVMRGGKIAETYITWDNLAGFAQLGLFPPPDANAPEE